MDGTGSSEQGRGLHFHVRCSDSNSWRNTQTPNKQLGSHPVQLNLRSLVHLPQHQHANRVLGYAWGNLLVNRLVLYMSSEVDISHFKRRSHPLLDN